MAPFLSMLSNRTGGFLRGLIIVAVIGLWMAIGALGGQAQGRLSSVQTNDAAAFLPASAESTRAAEVAQEFTDSETLPALVVATTGDGSALTPDDLAALDAYAQAVPGAPLEGTSGDEPATVGDVSIADPVVVPSEDGEAALVVVSLDASVASDRIGADESSVSELAVGALRDLAAATGAADPDALAAELLALYDAALASRARCAVAGDDGPTPLPWRDLAAGAVARYRA